MPAQRPRRRLLHLVGLALAAALIAGVPVLWAVIPMAVRGTMLERVAVILVFLSALALLTAAERIWTAIITSRNRPPDA